MKYRFIVCTSSGYVDQSHQHKNVYTMSVRLCAACSPAQTLCELDWTYTHHKIESTPIAFALLPSPYYQPFFNSYLLCKWKLLINALNSQPATIERYFIQINAIVTIFPLNGLRAFEYIHLCESVYAVVATSKLTPVSTHPWSVFFSKNKYTLQLLLVNDGRLGW